MGFNTQRLKLINYCIEKELISTKLKLILAILKYTYRIVLKQLSANSKMKNNCLRANNQRLVAIVCTCMSTLSQGIVLRIANSAPSTSKLKKKDSFFKFVRQHIS